MFEVLELDAEGWRRDGEPWVPTRPFYAVLGDPIAHSLSPAMQNAALMEREIDAEYHPVRIQASGLRRLKDSPVGQQLVGFNVTAPHKQAVSALCDGRTEQARDLGAVNTVKIEDGKWLGHNTDSGGVLTVVSQTWRDEERPERVVILGAGGSGRGAIDAMLRVAKRHDLWVLCDEAYEEIYFDRERTHHHIVSARTGTSPQTSQSVSVVAPTTLAADALATAVFVMEPERGIRFIGSFPQCACLIVDEGGRQWKSKGWRSANDLPNP